jgi:hypothetical protein
MFTFTLMIYVYTHTHTHRNMRTWIPIVHSSEARRPPSFVVAQDYVIASSSAIWNFDHSLPLGWVSLWAAALTESRLSLLLGNTNTTPVNHPGTKKLTEVSSKPNATRGVINNRPYSHAACIHCDPLNTEFGFEMNTFIKMCSKETNA